MDGSSTTGGRYVEWGFAIGRFGMLLISVGADTSGVFNTLAHQRFKNWDETIKYFTKEVDGNR